jgi:hypothetical protein
MQVKKLPLLLLTASILLTSCSISKGARENRNLLSGTWVLNDVAYENNTGKFKSVIFNDAEDVCFEGSNWFFRDNNSTARYTIAAKDGCSAGDRFIRWSVIERAGQSNQLQFKFIDEKLKDISGGLGYRLDIASLNEQAMTLKSNVSVDGEPITIVYEFSKK